MADFFDLNSWGTDSHLQFLNWTIDNNGAYDYAANTRGYTDGAIIEYDDHWWTVRFAETLMPKVANGINLDADIARARAENLEFEARGKLHRVIGHGVVRLLGYLNHADMGNYREAITITLMARRRLPTSLRRVGRAATNTASGSISSRRSLRTLASSGDSAGATGGTNRSRTPKWIAHSNWALFQKAARGIAETIARASSLSRTESWRLTSSISLSAELGFCSAMAG